MSSHNIKHGADGKLLHGPHGHLVDDCGSEAECACSAVTPCGNCPDITPSQFHVTFTGIGLCTGCVACSGVSFEIGGGATLSGTFLLTQNGNCAWTISSMDVPCTASVYTSPDCSGDATIIGFAIQQVRISATQFLLQVTDDSNTVLLFSATVDAANCCAGYTVANALTECGCGDSGVTLGTGGSATVTPC